MLGCSKPETDAASASNAASGQAQAEAGAKPRFDKEMIGKACELLTAEMAAEVLDVAPASLKQQSPMKGWCTWKSMQLRKVSRGHESLVPARAGLRGAPGARVA